MSFGTATNREVGTERARDRRFVRWPLILTALLVVQGAGVVWMVTIAGRDPSFALEPHYYEKAIAWDQAARQAGVNRSLGWSAEASISGQAVDGRRILRIALVDSLGRPLEAATVTAEVFHQARAAERVRVECGASSAGGGGGEYTGAAALPREGVYEVRLTVSRGPDVFTGVLNVETATGGGR